MQLKSYTIERLLTRKEVAYLLNVTPQCIANWHHYKRVDLPYFVHEGVARYEPSDVLEFIKKNKGTTTLPRSVRKVESLEGLSPEELSRDAKSCKEAEAEPVLT